MHNFCLRRPANISFLLFKPFQCRGGGQSEQPVTPSFQPYPGIKNYTPPKDGVKFWTSRPATSVKKRPTVPSPLTRFEQPAVLPAFNPGRKGPSRALRANEGGAPSAAHESFAVARSRGVGAGVSLGCPVYQTLRFHSAVA